MDTPMNMLPIPDSVWNEMVEWMPRIQAGEEPPADVIARINAVLFARVDEQAAREGQLWPDSNEAREQARKEYILEKVWGEKNEHGRTDAALYGL